MSRMSKLISSLTISHMSEVQQFSLFPMSEPRCNGINGSSDIDLPWFESRMRSILAVLMLKSPDYQASKSVLAMVAVFQIDVGT